MWGAEGHRPTRARTNRTNLCKTAKLWLFQTFAVQQLSGKSKHAASWWHAGALCSLESLCDGLCGSAEKTCTLDPAVKRTWSDDSWTTSTPLARTRPSGPRKYLGVSQKIRDRA